MPRVCLPKINSQQYRDVGDEGQINCEYNFFGGYIYKKRGSGFADVKASVTIHVFRSLSFSIKEVDWWRVFGYIFDIFKI